MTNADKIRSMTDEELAVNLADLICDKVITCPFHHGVSCEQCRMEWLKQEATDENTE